MKLRWICTLTLALCCGTAWADGRPDLKVQIGVEREVTVVDADGKTQVMREPVEKAEAGDVLVYTLRYHNVGEASAAGAVLSDPVPEGTVLIRSSVAGDNAEITFSTDGDTYSPWPQQERRAADGKVERVDAPTSSVRHVRWKLAQAVPPGAAGEASFKVIVQ
jgi:uncharacterized repeat protein (TIGR01451 family)